MNFTLDFHKLTFPQKDKPSWSDKVDRWYQLDAMAFTLCESMYRISPLEFDSLILCSPESSTETDYHFSHAELPSPQKFVHTLPNVRAAMALQVIDKKSELLCLAHSPYCLANGMEELLALHQEGVNALLTSCLSAEDDISLQSPKSYGVLTLRQDRKGLWQLKATGSNEMNSDQDLRNQLFAESDQIDFGPWFLEKCSD